MATEDGRRYDPVSSASMAKTFGTLCTIGSLTNIDLPEENTYRNGDECAVQIRWLLAEEKGHFLIDICFA